MNIDSFSKEGIHYSNEDSLFVCQLASDKVLAVLADGMGGLTLGKEAADLIVNSIITFIGEHIERLTAQNLLTKALEYADGIVAIKSKETHSKMGAAVAVALIDGNHIHYIWQGNVRIYFSKDGNIEQLTTDHMLDVGYGKHLLTRCIKGAGLRADVPYQRKMFDTGNILFLCTDGFYKMVEISQIIDKSLPINEEYEDDASLIKIVL